MSQSATCKDKPRKVTILAFDGVQALDICGPLDVFAQAEKRQPGSYDITCVAATRNVVTSAGLRLDVIPFDDVDLAKLGTLLIPGGDAEAMGLAIQDKTILSWLGAATKQAERVASVCTGAFFLASLGLLDKKRATTHWQGIELLMASAPSAEVERDAMYTEDGNLWTSAGIAAGMDLSLAIVRRDLGPDMALKIARDLVIPVARSTGQLAYAEPREWTNQPIKDLDGLADYVAANIHRPISVDEVASELGLSVRTFHRKCQDHYNMPPARAIQELRLRQVRASLLNSDAPMKEIAARLGYSDETALSHAFKRRFGVSPRDFRAGFMQA